MAVRDVVQAAAGQGGDKLYVEDVFSTYLYAGNNGSQTINNGIDLDGEGGLVWLKCRNLGYNHILSDTNRGTGKFLSSDTTAAQGTDAQDVSAFNTNGFTVGNNSRVNNSSFNYASWTFRKQPKFFDVVTYTGDGSSNLEVNHNLGVAPGMLIVKRTDSTSNWRIWHRGLNGGVNQYLKKISFTIYEESDANGYWADQNPTDTSFFLGGLNEVNEDGGTYVAYLFAHDAGGFGDDGEQNVISCGSYTGNGSATGPTITLGYEPQWLMIKKTNEDSDSDWMIFDVMRGIATGGNDAYLKANASSEEFAYDFLSVTATGFQLTASFDVTNGSGDTYIYIAIRRPMKTPEAGTEVFAINTFNAENVTLANQYAGFPIDLLFLAIRNGSALNVITRDRLRRGNYLSTSSTAVEAGSSDSYFDNMYGAKWGTGPTPDTNLLAWMFRRAPGFMDVVCYDGSGVLGLTLNHNLSAVPEMIWVKNRSASNDNWYAYHSSLGNTKYLGLNTTTAEATSINAWNNTSPTSTQFTVGAFDGVNGSSGYDYVAYLFATLPGVSKVGSYTGTGADLNVDCGFSAGARFIVIKRTDPGSTGDWYVWDSARGIVAGNDPYLLLNSPAAENTSTDYIDPLSSGFTVTSSAPAALNASGGTYIFLAIA